MIPQPAPLQYFGVAPTVALWILPLLALPFGVAVDRGLLARAGAATVGSALVAYGLREVLRAWGGGYYCCNHAVYVALGLVISAVGWVLLLGAFRGSVRATE